MAYLFGSVVQAAAGSTFKDVDVFLESHEIRYVERWWPGLLVDCGGVLDAFYMPTYDGVAWPVSTEPGRGFLVVEDRGYPLVETRHVPLMEVLALAFELQACRGLPVHEYC